MSLRLTLAVLLVAVAAAALANWQERRPRPLGEPAWLPFTLIQMVAILVALLMLAHLVSLLTGHQLLGRRDPLSSF